MPALRFEFYLPVTSKHKLASLVLAALPFSDEPPLLFSSESFFISGERRALPESFQQ